MLRTTSTSNCFLRNNCCNNTNRKMQQNAIFLNHQLNAWTKAKDYRDFKYISAANLSRLLKTTDIENTNYILIDCRLPIEFCRGSMTNAINLHTKEMIQHFYCMTHKARNSPKVLIFYSNHVIDEALRMAYFLRTLDLKTNDSDPSKLVFPTVYLMNESFKSFQKKFPGLIQASTSL